METGELSLDLLDKKYLVSNGKIGISPEMALRLSIAFNTTPESWLVQQVLYDLAKVRKKKKQLKVEKLAA